MGPSDLRAGKWDPGRRGQEADEALGSLLAKEGQRRWHWAEL